MKKRQQIVTDADRVLDRLHAMPEVELHSAIVIPLLKNQGAKHVEYVHGSFEKGKDILYVVTDFHGHNRLEVCQVKNKPFSGRAGDDHHTMTVLTQVQQCRKTEIRNPATGLTERPRGISLYSAYELPDKDTLGLARFLQEFKESECIFVGPDELVNKIKKFLPDLYADYAFPGGGLYRAIRRHVDVHHEALAFDLRSGDRKSLTQFFVNLGATQAGRTLDQLARGVLKARTMGATFIQNQHLADLEAQYERIRDKVGGLNLFLKKPLSNPASSSAQPEEVSKPEDDVAFDSKRKEHTQLDAILLAEFLTRAEQYLRRPTPPSQSPSCRTADEVADDIQFINSCDRLVETLASALRKEDVITTYAATPGYKLHVNDVPATAMLALNENLCVLGDAGAGKTSIARALARAALDRGDSCIYFPCSRVSCSDRTVSNAILDYLRELAGDRTVLDGSLLADVKWIILDGCDEAGDRVGALNQDIAELAFPKDLKAKVKVKLSDDPIIPADLVDRLRYDASKRTVIQSGPISRSDFHRLITLHDGNAYREVFESLLEQAAKYPQVIVTTREPVTLDALEWFIRIRLAQFTDAQLIDFFQRWFAGSDKSHEPLVSFLHGHPHIREVCRTPIVATIVAALYENGFDLPLTKTDVYSKRFELLIERWDKIRNVSPRNRVAAKDKLFFLQRLALKLHLARRRVFVKREAKAIWTAGFSKHYASVNVEDLLWELQACNSLIVSEGEGRYSLGHLSYQEFLAAKAIVSGQRLSLLRRNFYDPYWRQVLLFYAGITGDISRLIQQIQDSAPLVESRESPGFLDAICDEARYTPSEVRDFVIDVIDESEMNDCAGDGDEFEELDDHN